MYDKTGGSRHLTRRLCVARRDGEEAILSGIQFPSSRMDGILALLQAAPAAPAGFWEQNREKVVVGVVTAVVVLILSESIKALLTAVRVT